MKRFLKVIDCTQQLQVRENVVGFEKALRAVKLTKDQIQYRSQSLLNLALGYFSNPQETRCYGNTGKPRGSKKISYVQWLCIKSHKVTAPFSKVFEHSGQSYFGALPCQIGLSIQYVDSTKSLVIPKKLVAMVTLESQGDLK